MLPSPIETEGPDMPSTIARAVALAERVHAEQIDKGTGMP